MKSTNQWMIALSLAVLTMGVQQVLAVTTSITYVVGSCRPSSRSFALIQDALNATPPPNTVLVCPGPHNEQITITQPVNLQGLSSANGDQAVIGVPAGGLTQTANPLFEGTVYFQIYVNNVPGPVNISNLTVDGTGNAAPSNFFIFVAGIFYQNSPGSLSRVAVRNEANNANGYGIWLEGGIANPAVKATNNSVHGFDNTGIYAETYGAATSELTATISGNGVDASTGTGIVADQGATSTISGNLVGTPVLGILAVGGAAGSISGNTIIGTGSGTFHYGIAANADGVPVTSNKIFNSYNGMAIDSTVAKVQGNSITDSTVGINYQCNADPNAIGNTINDAATGINNVPSGAAVSNSYFNVATIRSQGSC